MWKPLKCRLFRGHDYQLRREPGVLLLECRCCGHRSRGWDWSEARGKRADSSLRLLIAEPGDRVRAVRAVDRAGPETPPMRIDEAELGDGGLRLTFGQED